MGDVTLLDFLETHGLLPPPRAEADVAFIPVTADLSSAARDVARQLRRAAAVSAEAVAGVARH